MKCTVCGEILSDYEVTIRHAITKQFLDTCKKCLSDIGNIPIQVRADLLSEMDLDAIDSLLDGTDDDFYDDAQSLDDDYDELWNER